MKILHIVGGPPSNGAYKGTYILHQALLDLNIDSNILNDHPQKSLNINNDKIFYINENAFNKILNIIFVFIEKLIKSIFLKSPRSTFTIGLLGFDITKAKQYKDADIIHIHWLSQGL